MTCSVRVSNELGLGHARATKYSVYATVSQSLLIGMVCMIIVLVTRNHFSIIFTDSREMQRAVAHLSGLLGITMVLNSVQPVISGANIAIRFVQVSKAGILNCSVAGVAVGGGWQSMVAYINLGCYYIFGLPLGYILGYVANLGVVVFFKNPTFIPSSPLTLEHQLHLVFLQGLWGGMIAGTAVQTLLLFLVLYKTDWNQEVISFRFIQDSRFKIQDSRLKIQDSRFKNIVVVQVEQTTERMRKWGGQDITT